jgi:steroid delta-isomerase-like uncharacterized protein
MAQTKTQPTDTVDEAFVQDFAERFLDAWNSHQVERVLELMNEDITYYDSAWPRVMHGHADVREFVSFTWRAFPDLRFEGVGEPLLCPGEPRAALWWKGYATNSGPIDPPGLAATGRRIEFEGGEFDTYRDGKLSDLKIVFDMADLMRQLGVLPPAGSGGERAMVVLQRAGTRVREFARR